MTDRPSRRRRRAPLIVVTAMLGTLVVPASAPAALGATTDRGTSKIAPRLLARTGSTTFWVELRGRADLGPARDLPTKPQKGAFVRSRSSAYAADSQAGLRALLRRRGATFEPFWIANSIKVVGDRDLMTEIARRPEVARIEPDTRISVPRSDTRAANAPGTAGTAGTASTAGSAALAPAAVRTATPAPVDGVEWNIHRIGADRVWNELGVRGEGVVVANIDSGVQFDHPALRDSYRGHLSNGRVDNDHNWFDPGHLCPTQSPCDNPGHGTHVMGIEVGATTDGANRIGVAPGATWIAANACGDLSCSREALLAAGQWMVAPTRQDGTDPRPDLAPDVVNNSWMRAETADYFGAVLDAWVAAGILPVFAAGNNGNGGSCSTNTWPASFAKAYAVANVDDEGQVDSSSSRGPTAEGETKPDIAAPGTGIRSASPDFGYVLDTGTSMAAPHVAGAVALLWSAAPALAGDVAATRELLDDTAADLDDTRCGGTADDNDAAGEGVLDVYRAVRAAPRTGLGGLSGLVRDSRTGAPVADAELVLTGPRTTSLRTDGAGRFRLDRMMPGTYAYRLDAPAHQEAKGSVVVPASRITRTLPLAPAPTTTLTGVVRSADGPVAGAEVAVANTPAATRTDAEGRYRLSVPTGVRELTAEAPSRCSLLRRVTVTVTAGHGQDFDLAPRTDAFGHTCSPVTDGYRAGTTKLDLSGASGATGELKLPFAMPLYGQSYDTAYVSTNGVIGLGLPPEPPFGSGWFDPLPAPWNPAPALFPFYAALDVDAEAGIWTTVSPDQVVVEWRDVEVHLPQSGSPGGRLSFSATLRPDGTVTYAYRGLDPGRWTAGRSALIGLQDETGSDAFAFGNLEPVVTDDLAFTVRPPTP
jgi:subtilisin family serine protease